MSTFSQVKRYLDALDPQSLLTSHAPADEYDAESRKISARIAYSDAPEQIAAVIAEVFAAAFSVPESPARFLETAVQIRRALCYEYYGGIADQFASGTISDADCIRTANEIIRQTLHETDTDILEMMVNAVWVLVTHRNLAAQLDLRPLTENPQRLGTAALEYLPDIFAERS